jgi:ribulose-bisphosphate carboxylase large chain
MTLARVNEMLDFYGRDVMLLIGGDLLLTGDRLTEATREFADTVANYAA